MLTFIRYIGNEDTDVVYPESLVVNRDWVIKNLQWLQVHNPYYKDVVITEDNFVWINGVEEASIATDGTKVNMKDNAKALVVEDEEEIIPKAHCTQQESDDNDLLLLMMHPDKKPGIPCGK